MEITNNQFEERNEKSRIEINRLTPEVQEVSSDEAKQVQGGAKPTLAEPEAARGKIMWE